MASLPKNLVIDIKCEMPVTYKIVTDNKLVMSVKSKAKAIKKIAKICAKYDIDIKLYTLQSKRLVSVENKEIRDVKV